MPVEYQKVWRTMNDLEMVTSKICSAREIIDNAIDKIQDHQNDKAETLMNAAYEFLEYYLKEFDEKFKLAWQSTVGDLRDGDVREEDPCMSPWGHSDLEYISKHKQTLTCDKDDISPECQGAWNDFWSDGNEWQEDFEEQLKKEGYEYTPLPTKADGYSVDGKSHSDHYYDYTRNDPNRPNPFQDKVKKWILPVEECKDSDTDQIEYFVSFPDDLLEATNLTEGDQVEWVDKGDGSYILRKVIKPVGMDEC